MNSKHFSLEYILLMKTGKFILIYVVYLAMDNFVAFECVVTADVIPNCRILLYGDTPALVRDLTLAWYTRPPSSPRTR